ncbi:lysosomal Pro-X carboxypeptidase [Cucumis sativus]|uniref:Lysosomal Pro-X carboxypeptidase n=1 Tax=Cucumis sativus TaxID=3659 RepID=A0A0A0LE34_CUCSA|nr:lysosomal Pro-X carboxypeptidase [Cucumis sativus]KGN59164.1 hypothetical protein Csa_000811 [Cucumis sativus]
MAAAPSISLSIFLFLSLHFTSSFSKIPLSFPSSLLLRPQSSPIDPLLPYQTSFFTQILDHFNFNPQSYQSFQQRYLINDTYWGGAAHNSPIFVYTGNEGNIEWFAQNTGFLLQYAPHFRALVVFIEHRFYGKSIPFGGDEDVANSNSSMLGYLSSTQALADYATLITDLKKNLSAVDSPVLVFGGSYGGMLAAWFRLKYPHIALGALASSAPILQLENITSPYAFNNIVTQDFKSESQNCYSVIKESWHLIDITSTHPQGPQLLRKSFKFCKEAEAESIKNWLSTAIIYTAMTDYPTPSNFLNPLPAYPVKQMCKAIDDPRSGNDSFTKLYGAANIYYNFTGTVTCFDLDDDSDPHDLGDWSWQACTEMILPTGGNTKESIFPASTWHFADRFQFCKTFFDVEPRRIWIPTHFGGHNIERVLKRFGSNIIFFNGLRDPWSGGGVLKNISSTIIAIVAKEGAHHVDLRFSNPDDPKWLKDVRKQEVNIIEDWLSQYYLDLAQY